MESVHIVYSRLRTVLYCTVLYCCDELDSTPTSWKNRYLKGLLTILKYI